MYCFLIYKIFSYLNIISSFICKCIYWFIDSSCKSVYSILLLFWFMYLFIFCLIICTLHLIDYLPSVYFIISLITNCTICLLSSLFSNLLKFYIVLSYNRTVYHWRKSTYSDVKGGKFCLMNSKPGTYRSGIVPH